MTRLIVTFALKLDLRQQRDRQALQSISGVNTAFLLVPFDALIFKFCRTAGLAETGPAGAAAGRYISAAGSVPTGIRNCSSETGNFCQLLAPGN